METEILKTKKQKKKQKLRKWLCEHTEKHTKCKFTVSHNANRK